MANVKVADSVIPSKVNTPLDARSRVAYEFDILNIENPAVGQLVYCTGTGKFYVVKTLKAKQVGAIVVQDGAVDTYEELASIGTPGEPGEPGAPGKDGTDGEDGYTPVRGVDYWTEEDIAEIKSYIDNAIMNGEW